VRSPPEAARKCLRWARHGLAGGAASGLPAPHLPFAIPLVLCSDDRSGSSRDMKIVRIADLEAHVREHLRAVQRGETPTIVDRDTPIARIVPLSWNMITDVDAPRMTTHDDA
jgi:hypothetical protein